MPEPNDFEYIDGPTYEDKDDESLMDRVWGDIGCEEEEKEIDK